MRYAVKLHIFQRGAHPSIPHSTSPGLHGLPASTAPDKVLSAVISDVSSPGEAMAVALEKAISCYPAYDVLAKSATRVCLLEKHRREGWAGG